ERIADRDAVERRRQPEGAVAEANVAARHRRHELLGIAHHVGDGRAAAVPLDHRELRVVARASLAPAKARSGLVDALRPTGEESLHLVFGRRAEPARRAPFPACDLERIEVNVESRRRHHEGRLHLEEAARVEESAHVGADARALAPALHREPGGVSPRRTISTSCPEARRSPPCSALRNAHVIVIASSARKTARAARWGDTSSRSSPAPWPSAMTPAMTSRYALNFGAAYSFISFVD